MAPDASPPPFVRFGPAVPATPVVIAVPHAGRVYPPELLAAARLGRPALELLEDRLADLLAADAAAAGATVFVATTARAWIDLNRAPEELDPGMVVPPPAGTLASAKVRGGLGLIPRRIAGHGEVYARPLPAADVARRIAGTHAPWHAALSDALAAARARFGVAVLLDLHSMPPLPGPAAPLLVVGDRHGDSAGAGYVAAALRHAALARLRPALNAPYAGGHALDRHGHPATGIHALQVELCRSLYLDPARRGPGAGVETARAFVAALVDTLVAEALPPAIAAE